MKKKLYLLGIMLVVCLSVFGCGKKESAVDEDAKTEEKSEYPGTWTLTKVTIDGSEFTVEEAEAMGDDTLTDVKLIIKEGGKCAIVEQGEATGMVDWEENETGIKMGVQELVMEDSCLVMTMDNGNKMYYEKTSDDQTIPSNEETDQESAETESTDDTITSSEVTPEFKQAMDEYEAFFDEYVDFMNTYASSTDQMSMMADYQDYMTQYTETMEAMDEIDTSTLSDADLAYYTEVSGRISQKLLEIAM